MISSCIRLSVLLLLLPLELLAQTNEGILTGSVIDPTGAAIQGAQVTAKAEATGGTLTAVTGAGGNFRFSSIPIGLYDVTVKQPGFSSVTQSGVNVSISTTSSITISMKVGKSEQSVTVQADATTIQTQSSDIGTVVTAKQVMELPLALGGVGALRSPEAFAFLAPGTTGPGTANSSNGVFISKLGGGQNFGNEVLLDGASILRTENGSSFDEAAPSVEAISEFRVITSTMPAIYGRTTGAVEVFGTKSGTNQFHGTAYDILQNDDLNANSWFNNGYAASCTPQPACRSQYARPVDKKNDYGTNLGGPVWIPKLYDGRNKTFFFFNWEQFSQHIGGTNESILPTAAQRGGDFSGIVNTASSLGTNPCTGQPIYSGQIFDPNTTTTGPNGLPCRTAFPGNKIPVSRISPVTQNFLNYLPLPNMSQTPGVINYALSSATPLANTTYTIRIDHQISDKSKIFAMYDTRDNSRYTGGNGTLTLPAPIDSNGWNQNFVTHYGRAGWDYIFSPTVVNHLNLGYNRTNSQNYTSGALEAISGNFNWNAKLGLAGLSGTQFPIVNIGEGVPGISRANNDDNIDNGERFNDNLTWVKGNHNLTMGFDFRNQLFATYANDSDTGVYNFARAETAATQAVSGNSGNGIASFLLGDVDNGNAVIQAHVPRWTFQYYAAFLQDDWKATQHLTLNLGLRWDVDVPRVESYNETSNFSPTQPNPAAGNLPGGLVFGNTCSGCNPRWADTKFHDVGPRLGFAYNPHGGRLVIRGGYGIIYSPLQYTDYGGGQTQGFSATPTFSSANGFTPAFNWNTGFPGFPPAPNTNPSIVNAGTPDWIQPRFGQPGIIQSWSFQLQEQVSKDMVATLGYVGLRSQNLRSNIMNSNNIALSALGLGQALNQPVTNNTLGITAPYAGFYTDWGNTVNVGQALRPFPQYNYIYTDVLQNIGQSTYEALQASLERRFSSGLSLQSSFTWSKTITDADSLIPDTATGGISQVQNPDELRSEKALSSQDVPFAFTGAALYELPFGHGKRLFNHGIGSAVLGGWQIGTVLRYQSGVPISFGCANGIPDWQNCIRFNRASRHL